MKPHGQPSVDKTSSLLVNFAAIIFAAVIFLTTGISSAADIAPTNAYASWIKPWSERPATSPALDAPLTLIVSNVRGELDAAVATMTPVQRLNLAFHIQVSAAEVATNGGFRSYVVSNTDARTGDVRWLSPNGIWQLDQLISILPEDNAELPPAGNRMVFQFRAEGHWRIRVYDGNNLPPEAQAILNLLAKPYAKLF